MKKCRLNRGEGEVYRELISLSEEQGKEMGVSLCRTDEGAVLAGTLCVGNKCSVTIDPDTSCPYHMTFMGTAHTHPGAWLSASKADLETALAEGEERACTIGMSGAYLCLNNLNNILGRKRRLTLVERLVREEKRARFFTKHERSKTDDLLEDELIFGRAVVDAWNEILEPLGANACLSEL